MNIIEVIPITHEKVPETLSYFSTADPAPGAIVSVPLRTRHIPAIISTVRPAIDMKSEIRRAPYEIRKLAKIKATSFLNKTFMDNCAKLANYYATHSGAIINTLINRTLLDNASKIAPPIYNNRPKSEIVAIQGDDNDRISSWRSLIRQEFARKRSLVFYVPTIESGNWLFESLERGVEEYIFTLNSDITEKKIVETWNTIAETEHPVVVIATGSFSIMPRSDIETVVIERENDHGWIGQKAPFLDHRYAIETLTRSRGDKLYVADVLLRNETLFRTERNDISAGQPFKWRSISNAEDMFIDMKDPDAPRIPPANTDDKSDKSKFKVLSDQLLATVSANREDNTHLFLFALRRGLATSTVCDDCDTIVACNVCGAPIVLHTSANGSNFYLCHRCGDMSSADRLCDNCNSWRLAPLGIGIDRVYKEIVDKSPGTEVFRIDADTTKTPKQIRAVIDRFVQSPGSVLVGTELAIAYLPSRIDHIGIVSLDSLFALPDFRIPEKIMYLLTRFRNLAERSIIVQTRKAEEKIFEYGIKGNLSDFYRITIAERKRFQYPPYRTLIKLSIEGKKDIIAKAMSEIERDIKPYEIDIFPAFTSSGRGNSNIHGLLRIDPIRWPDQRLVNLLRNLPPSVSVRIDPESLL